MTKQQRQETGTPGAGNSLKDELLRVGFSPTEEATPVAANEAATRKAPRPGTEEESRLFFALAQAADALREFYSLSGSQKKVLCLPLGHIPGPAVLLQGGEVVAVTPGVTPNATDLAEALQKFEALVEGLDGQKPSYSSWEATTFRKSRELEVPLVMGLTALKWDDRAGPYGLVLLPGVREGTVVVLRVYNPEDFPPSLQSGQSYPVSELLDKPGATQKLLAVWASFEARYHGRYQAYHR